ncbi:hypothetical protein HUU39_00045 [candidate division KSB1 bacterium]|nr:hypothetical protein [bacterium]NUM63661.1 hypothetical protein [candidate division KSB1 bacterium]
MYRNISILAVEAVHSAAAGFRDNWQEYNGLVEWTQKLQAPRPQKPGRGTALANEIEQISNRRRQEVGTQARPAPL